MSIREIGCCGAYCKTCMAAKVGGPCRGFKLGYDTGEKDINKSRCQCKNCCFRDKKSETCADCSDYPTCELIHGLYAKKAINIKNINSLLNSSALTATLHFSKSPISGNGHTGNSSKI